MRRRIAWCPAPEGRPVDARVRAATASAVALLAQLGHEVREVPVPIDDWLDAFGPLVLADEWRFRRHLLDGDANGLTTYTRRTIEAAKNVTDESVASARKLTEEIRARIGAMFQHYDLIVTPTTASPPFRADQRPTEIDGHRVGALWGPFPFTAPFNVSGSPAASLPVGVCDGLPIGLQVVGPDHGEALILDVCEQLERVVGFPSDEMRTRWRMPAPKAPHGDGGIGIAVKEGVAVLRLQRPQKRNALTRTMLDELKRRLAQSVTEGAVAVVLTGDESTFSAGMDLGEVGNGTADAEVDSLIAETGASIRTLPIPVIAAIEGPCLGAAADLALACDVRIMGVGARFGIPAVKLGILYRPEGIADMVATVGRETVSRLLLFGERLTAEQAVMAGLAAQVVPAGQALDAALTLAQGAVGSPREALAATKGVITEIVGDGPNLESWQERRLALLRSEQRTHSLDAARTSLGVAIAGERQQADRCPHPLRSQRWRRLPASISADGSVGLRA